jgi:hypothetical protein
MITIKNTYKTDKINTHTNKLLEDITSDEAHDILPALKDGVSY